jgi:hypothetical protein
VKLNLLVQVAMLKTYFNILLLSGEKSNRVHRPNGTRFGENMEGIIKENSGSCIRRARKTKQLTCDQRKGILLFLLQYLFIY